jgi:hypothetical protein
VLRERGNRTQQNDRFGARNRKTAEFVVNH